MPVLSLEQLRSQLRQRKIAPVYVLFGAETYLRDVAAKTIADFAFDKGDFREFNETEISLNDPDSLLSAIAAAEQLPMMSGRRVVRVTDVRVAATAARDSLTEAHLSSLSAYLSRPSESSVVIFMADELNANRKLGKLLREYTVAVEFKALDDNQLVKWANGRVRELGSEIDDRALSTLVGLTGEDLRRLANEIAKLSTAALPDKRITVELIEELVANSREISNFGLTDHLNGGRRTRALQTLEKILNDGAEPLMILGLMAANFHRMYVAKDLMARGASPDEVNRVAKLPWSGKQEFLAAARRAEMSTLAEILERLNKADIAIKTSVGGGGPAGSRLQIEALVCDISGLLA